MTFEFETKARIAVRDRVTNFATQVAQMDFAALRAQQDEMNDVLAAYGDDPASAGHAYRLLAIVNAVFAAKFPDLTEE